jgi:hypothetical protein
MAILWTARGGLQGKLEVLAHMIEALAYFRPGVPREAVSQALAFFESFSCDPAKK